LQQSDYLGLHRHIQRGERLVRHDESRTHRQGARDAYTLALTAAELVRVPVEVAWGQADTHDERPRLPLAIAGPNPARGQRYSYGLAHCVPGVKRAIRVLEDYLSPVLQIGAAEPIGAPYRQSVIEDLPRRRFGQSYQSAAESALSAA